MRAAITERSIFLLEDEEYTYNICYYITDILVVGKSFFIFYFIILFINIFLPFSKLCIL